jgi:PAS domain-containing protein
VSLTARARRTADGQLAGIDKRYRRLGDECAIVRQLTLEAGDFARLFARTPMPMCITRMTDGTVLAINTSFQSFMGRTEEALLGHRTLDLGLWRSAGERSALLERLHREGRVHNARWSCSSVGRATRRTSEVLANIEPVTLGGQPCLYVLLNDISGWRQAERQLQRRDREFADLVNSASDAIVSIDAHQRVCLFNRAAEQMFQVSAEEALGQTLDRFIPGDGAAATRPWCSSSSTAAPKPGAWAAAG